MNSIRWILVGMLLGLLSCASTGQSGPEVGPLSTDEGIPVWIDNSSTGGYRVFAVIQQEERLIGRVDGLSTADLRLPQGISGNMALAVRPSNASLGRGERHTSQPFTVSSGQRVEWRIRASTATVVPQLSAISIYACDERQPC